MVDWPFKHPILEKIGFFLLAVLTVKHLDVLCKSYQMYPLLNLHSPQSSRKHMHAVAILFVCNSKNQM